MSNIIVEGFAAYGTGSNSDKVRSALLAGAYADIVGSQSTLDIAQNLPWDPAEGSFWLHCTKSIANSALTVLRRVLPGGSIDPAFFSFQMALAALPDQNGVIGPIDFRNGANQVIATLYVQSTGVMALDTGAQIVSTATPVIVAEKVHHLEMKLDADSGVFILKVDETTVINGSGLSFTHADDCAQFSLQVLNSAGNADSRLYLSHLIVRDTATAFNNDFVGNRFVATLFPNADDVANQGWTAFPIERFGVGVLDLTDPDTLPSPSLRSAVIGPSSSVTSIGVSDFTLEGSFRLKALPSGSDLSVLMGKWDEGANQRSYQLYQGGPALENGNLVFRTSTDGLNGTVVNKLLWPWSPVVGQWYHIAVARAAGVLRLFIDGVQAGIDVADGDTYFAATSPPCIGASIQGTGSSPDSIVGTGFYGWQDEFRLTIGVCRYTTNFTPPTDKFPRGGDDPSWADVAWISGWDNAAIADDSSHGLALVSLHAAAALTPDDGDGAYQTIREHAPNDDNFIDAALIAASNILTFSAVAGNTETVTVGTTDGATPAVYTFKTVLASAYDVLRGATATDSAQNFIAAINHDAGEGTLYGTGTAANFDVAAAILPVLSQAQVIALTPGAAGNAIASTETLASGAWAHASTLHLGQDIPAVSDFTFDRLPPAATVVDSVTLVGRQYKTDSGEAKTKTSLVGIAAGVLDGTEKTLGTAPNLTFDLFQEDPDSAGDPLTPQVVRTMRSKINRTA